MHLNYSITTCGDGGNAFLQKTDSVINVKVEFRKDKVLLDNIARRIEAYKQKERVKYKKRVHRSELWLQNKYLIYRRGKEGVRIADG